MKVKRGWPQCTALSARVQISKGHNQRNWNNFECCPKEIKRGGNTARDSTILFPYLETPKPNPVRSQAWWEDTCSQFVMIKSYEGSNLQGEPSARIRPARLRIPTLSANQSPAKFWVLWSSQNYLRFSHVRQNGEAPFLSRHA